MEFISHKISGARHDPRHSLVRSAIRVSRRLAIAPNPSDDVWNRVVAWIAELHNDPASRRAHPLRSKPIWPYYRTRRARLHSVGAVVEDRRIYNGDPCRPVTGGSCLDASVGFRLELGARLGGHFELPREEQVTTARIWEPSEQLIVDDLSDEKGKRKRKRSSLDTASVSRSRSFGCADDVTSLELSQWVD